MQLVGDKMRYSAKDVVAWTYCQHLAAVETRVARGLLERPDREDTELDFLTKRGDKHERDVLEKYRAEGKTIVEINTDDRSEDGIATMALETQDAMRSGVDIIYQATFVNDTWVAYADFIRRTPGQSKLGDYIYEPIDAKLARHVRVPALLQLALYAELITEIQGAEPHYIYVALGDGTESPFPYRDIKHYFDAVRDRALNNYNTYDLTTPLAIPDPAAHCKLCTWFEVCDEQRRESDHLSIVSGLGRDNLRKLRDAGIDTATQLAHTQTMPEAATQTIRSATLSKLQNQARLQLHTRTTGEYVYDLVTAEPDTDLDPAHQTPRGLALLPSPSIGDVFFDFEGDPFIEPRGREYLIGLVDTQPGTTDRVGEYKHWWGHEPDTEKEMVEHVIDYFMDRWKTHPDFHIYHYANYEIAALLKLCSFYGTREHELDELLRGERFVDLYRVVRQGLCTSTESQSIKDIEHFYKQARTTEIVGGAQSIVTYENWLDTGNDELLEEIRAYNEDDCESTLLLRNWLEGRRAELEARDGLITRPELLEGQATEKVAANHKETDALVEKLLAGTSPDAPIDSPEHTQRLLANLLNWHDREDRPGYRKYFDRMRAHDDELFHDHECISGLEFIEQVPLAGQSDIFRYKFPPQEHKFSAGDKALAAGTNSSQSIHAIDNSRGLIEIKRARRNADSHPSALMPSGPIDATAMKSALRRVAGDVVANGLDGSSRYQSARDLLKTSFPRRRESTTENQTDASDASNRARERGTSLDNSYLAVQGPPGTGKTYTAAQLAIDLVEQGRKIGVTAQSHRAIGNLLEEIVKLAAKRNVTVAITQKPDDPESAFKDDCITLTTDNKVIRASIDEGTQIVAGTAWLFAREEWDGVLDTVIIDEASQFSLANAVAVSTAARNLVLFGDPQQLSHVSEVIHADGSGASALGHVVGNEAVISPERGVFLDVTRRMHPNVCSVVSEISYNGELHSDDACSNQVISDTRHPGREAIRDLNGAGVHYVAVEHVGNRVSSPEEAQVVCEIVEELLGGNVTDRDKVTRPLTTNDILVVAPYNAHVACLREVLPDGIQIGTVDKFQGREAPVVIYSLAVSSPDNITRGIEFLYSTNRLNVALSRARALAIIVANPSLATPMMNKVHNIQLVNAFCHATHK